MKKIIYIMLISMFLVTGCSFGQTTEQTDPELEIIEDLTTMLEYNSSDTASPLKLKFTISNNTKEEFQVNNVTFLIQDINDQTHELVKEVNYIVKIGEEYIVEAECDINPENVKQINYNF